MHEAFVFRLGGGARVRTAVFFLLESSADTGCARGSGDPGRKVASRGRRGLQCRLLDLRVERGKFSNRRRVANEILAPVRSFDCAWRLRRPPYPQAPLTRLPICGALGILEEANLHSAVKISDTGFITTTLFSAAPNPNDYYHAFSYSNGSFTDLGTLGGVVSIGEGVNSAGQVVGVSYTAAGDEHAFVYSGGVMHDLGTFGGGNSSFASGINDSGQIAGTFRLAGTSAYHAFIYSAGVTTDLGTVGGLSSAATAINNSGQVAGYVTYPPNGTNNDHAALYSNGVLSDIGTLGGNTSFAYGINNYGHVVGEATQTSSLSSVSAFIYSNGVMTAVSPLAWANDINDADAIVGRGPGGHAWLVSNNVATDLNSLIDPSSGWTLLDATGINNSGAIVGYGQFNGEIHAFLLVPEPSGMTLALVSLASWLWRRKKVTLALA